MAVLGRRDRRPDRSAKGGNPGGAVPRRRNGGLESWTALGPFLYSEPALEEKRVGGFRPFYVEWTAPTGEAGEFTVLYPLFYYRSYGANYEWSLFKLSGRELAAGNLSAVIELLAMHDLESSLETVVRYLERARRALKVLPDSGGRAGLLGLADFLTQQTDVLAVGI